MQRQEIKQSLSHRLKIRLVPEDFVYPSTDLKTVWRLWYYGNVDKGISPNRNVIGHEDDLWEESIELISVEQKE